MSGTDTFRPLSRVDLRPVFTSLGLPVTAFRSGNVAVQPSLFDAVLNADATRPNGLWLFKGADYFLFDLLTGEITEGPKPIAGNWGGDTLPQLFRTGIHSAAWGGPAFPHLWYFFKDEMYVGMNSLRGWNVVEGPRGILGAWATGAWSNPDGTWKTPGVPVALHGLGSEFDGMVHFFKDSQYVRHNLRTGQLVAGPQPIKDAWSLPEPFTSRLDHAFYGTGPNEEHIFFISGEQYVLYDFRLRKVIKAGSVEERFPAFARFLGRPQLFLVEDYTLETLVGPPHLGRLIDTRSIGAGSTIKKILVTETTDTTRERLSQSVLSSQEATVMSNFYDKLDNTLASTEDSERYRYQLNAHAHGEAEANSLWGGEVDATLDVQGGTDTVRTGLSQAAFKSISRQVEESKRQTEQRTYNSEAEILSTVKVLKKEIFEETNTSDRVRVYEFYEQLQPYITLLSLRRVRMGFSDGTDRPKVVELPALEGLLREILQDSQLQKALPDFVRGELTHVTDHTGTVGSVISESATSTLVMKPNLTSTFQVPRPDGTVQNVTVQGVITAARSWIEPTFTITCIQV
jgi:hypothetical protein